jgi:hypothetical protein
MSKKSTKHAAGPKQEAKTKGNQTTTQKKTRVGKVAGVQPTAEHQAAEPAVEPVITAEGIHSLTAGAKPTAKAAKGTAPKPKETEAVKESPDDAEELVVFAFRLSRAERDLIHAAAGSAKASKLVRTLAVAAARGDGPAVLGILDTLQAKQ